MGKNKSRKQERRRQEASNGMQQGAQQATPAAVEPRQDSVEDVSQTVERGKRRKSFGHN